MKIFSEKLIFGFLFIRLCSSWRKKNENSLLLLELGKWVQTFFFAESSFITRTNKTEPSKLGCLWSRKHLPWCRSNLALLTAILKSRPKTPYVTESTSFKTLRRSHKFYLCTPENRCWVGCVGSSFRRGLSCSRRGWWKCQQTWNSC